MGGRNIFGLAAFNEPRYLYTDWVRFFAASGLNDTWQGIAECPVNIRRMVYGAHFPTGFLSDAASLAALVA